MSANNVYTKRNSDPIMSAFPLQLPLRKSSCSYPLQILKLQISVQDLCVLYPMLLSAFPFFVSVLLYVQPFKVSIHSLKFHASQQEDAGRQITGRTMDEFLSLSTRVVLLTWASQVNLPRSDLGFFLRLPPALLFSVGIQFDW